MEALFVYGTLKDPAVQQNVIGRVVSIVPDVLECYLKSTITINGKTYPIIVPGLGNVEGFVISVTHDELRLLDEYETSAYKRKKVILKSGRSAWAYQK